MSTLILTALLIPPPEIIGDPPKPAAATVVASKPVFEITLKDNPTTGYVLVLKSMSKGIYLLNVTSTRGSAPGAGGSKKFQFLTTLKSGKGKVVFSRFRPWNAAKTTTDEPYVVDVSLKKK